MKDDERAFLVVLAAETHIPANRRRWPRDIINEPGFPMHHKRAWRILEKWTDKGWYEFGVTLDLGWLTEEGLKQVD